MSEVPQKQPYPEPEENSIQQRNQQRTMLDKMAMQHFINMLQKEISTGNPHDKYHKLVKISDDNDCSVFHGETISGNQQVTVRVIPLCVNGCINHSIKELMVTNSFMHNPYIVQYLDSYIVADSLWIVMERVEGITLTQLLQREQNMSVQQIALICGYILLALERLHETGIIHHDVTSDNILLGQDGKVKLADCRKSKPESGYLKVRCGNTVPFTLLPKTGSPRWMAPELITGSQYDHNIDIWALGITVLEMLCKRTPYAGASNEEACWLILETGTPTIVKGSALNSLPDLKDFLLQCLHVDPKKRATASNLLKHEFLDRATTVDELASCVAEIQRFQQSKVSVQNIPSIVKMEISGANPHEKYKLLEKIGHGGGGSVYRAETIDEKQPVAIKIIPFLNIGAVEMLIHRDHPHENIVQYMNSFMDGGSIWIVMEYVDGIILTHLNFAMSLKEQHIAYICRKLLLALEKLHNAGIIHRDVKACNVLIGKDSSVKLADLGGSIPENGQLKLRGGKTLPLELCPKIGSPRWMAPELITSNEYDCKVDIWALGITTIEMLDKCAPYIRPPYTHSNDHEIWQLILDNGTPQIVKGDALNHIPDLQDFLRQCLNVDPKKRPTASQLLQHKFLNKATATVQDELIDKVPRIKQIMAKKKQRASKQE